MVPFLGNVLKRLRRLKALKAARSHQFCRCTWPKSLAFAPSEYSQQPMAWEEDEEWRKVPPHSRGRHVQGIIMLAACLVLWVSSSAAVQLLATNSVQQFQQPLFVTLFNSTMGILLLAPYLLPKTDLRSGLVATGWMSATVGILWLCSQCLYNVSLLHTSVATNTVLSSTSSIFTFVLSLLTGNHFRPRSCVGVSWHTSFTGIVIVPLFLLWRGF